jgi:uncharacterized protein (TIGR02611 family)
LRALYRVGVGIVGGAVLLLGIVLIPYPGPGWLVVFAGLGILATEFTWAKAVLTWVKARYDRWAAWLKRQHWVVKALVLLFVTALVVATLWILNAFALVGKWVGIHWPWLTSPVFG